MKTVLVLITIGFTISLSSCRSTDTTIEKEVDRVVTNTTYISLLNVAFRASHVECLYQQWLNDKYHNDPPIVFRVINDAKAYAEFFPCSLRTPLPSIDFSVNTLLIGMKADNGRFVNSPVNISRIEQNLVQTNSGKFLLEVKVTGRQAASGYGGEWFAFASVVPKLTGTTDVDMQYKFE